VLCRGAVKLPEAPSGADLGCSSGYSIGDVMLSYSVVEDCGAEQVSVPTAVAHG